MPSVLARHALLLKTSSRFTIVSTSGAALPIDVTVHQTPETTITPLVPDPDRATDRILQTNAMIALLRKKEYHMLAPLNLLTLLIPL